MDYDKILKSLPVFNRVPSKLVITAEDVARRAKEMGRRAGYRHSAKTLEALDAYLNGYGILLTGGLGLGKTLFFQCVEPKPIPTLSFNSCHLWDFSRLESWLEEHSSTDILVDDIGAEKIRVDDKSRNYGQKYEALQVVLDYRSNSGNRTHFTTNNNSEELEAIYGGRVLDRIYGFAIAFKLPQSVSMRNAVANGYAVKKVMDWKNKQGRDEP